MTRWLSAGLRGLFSMGITMAMATLSCTAPPVGRFCPIPDHATPEQTQAALCACELPSAQYQAVYSPAQRYTFDLLLVVGNTAGMVEKQRTLAKLPIWDQLLSNPRVDAHVAIVSTDVGSWVAPGQPFSQPAGACDSFAGDDGAMQAVSCLDRTGLSPAAQAACAELCPDRRFVPTDGRPFLARDGGRSNVPISMEPDPQSGRLSDVGLAHALRCLLVLGEGGCAISSPLEAAKRALDAHRQDSSGFLRKGVPLFIVFLTDRDDCSMRLGQRAENDPLTLRCDSPDPTAPLRCFEAGPYRCLAADVACEQPLNQTGDKTLCHPRDDSPLSPVRDYLRFFSAISPKMAITALSSMPATGQGARITATQRPGTFDSAGLALEPACRSSVDPGLSGLPQRRMSDLIATWHQARELGEYRPPVSVCEPTRYHEALDALLGLPVRDQFPICQPGRPSDERQEPPPCLVGYVPWQEPQALPSVLWPTCGTACCAAFAASQQGQPWEPEVMDACSGERQSCYCLGKPQRSLCPPHRYGDAAELVSLWEAPSAGPPPAGSGVSVRCAIDPASLAQCGSR